MSEDATTVDVATEVPEEVQALDGVLSEDEAHNAERPGRGSGLHKHKKSGSPRKSGKPISELEIGSTIEGTVKTITSYGAFLDIGYATDALLHVSRMSDDFTSNVEDVVKQGEVVTVRVLNVDTERNQVAVTMRSEEAEARKKQERQERQPGTDRRKERPQRSGGDREAQRLALIALSEKGIDEGKFVEGEVVNTLDFGAFVRFDTSQLGEGLEGELDGLVHISAMTEGRAESVSAIVKIGDKVQVRVKGVDVEGNKVALSMITKEQESAGFERGGERGSGRGGSGDRESRPKRSSRTMFRSDEMGAGDWKESMEKLTDAMPEFKNEPIFSDKRK